MRGIFRLVAVAVLAAFPLPSLAQLHCRPLDVLERYVADHRGELPSAPFYLLTYDHGRRPGWWQAYRCPTAGRCDWNAPLGKPIFELQPSGAPRLTVPKESKLAVLVIGTNPLSYGVAPGESKEVAHEDFPDLQRFALLLGGTVTSASTLLARNAIIGANIETALQPGPAQPGAMGALAALAATEESEAALAGSPNPPPAAFRRWFAPITHEVTAAGIELKALLDALGKARDGFQVKLTGLDDMERLLRAVEVGAADELRDARLHTLPPVRVSEGDLHRSLRELRDARATLAGHSPLCLDGLRSLERLLHLRLDPDSAFQREYAELAKKLSEEPPCKELEHELVAASGWFSLYPLTGPPPPEVELALLGPLRELIHGYRTAAEKRQTALNEAKDVLDNGGAAGSRASNLAYVHERLTESTRRIDPVSQRDAYVCALTQGVLRVARGQGDAIEVPWNSVRSETFTLTFDGNAKAMTAVRATPDKKDYELASTSPWRNIDVDLGLTHSPIVDPTFSAVSIASLGALAPPDATDPKALVIAQTREERRSGVPAIFATWFPGRMEERAVGLGWQLGVGLDSDHPALFLGPALSLGRYFKLAAGVSAQEVTELAREQRIGMSVVAATDVRTSADFETDWYVGFTLTLDDLPLFGGGKQ